MSIVPRVSPWYDPSSAKTRTCGSASSGPFGSPPGRTNPRRACSGADRHLHRHLHRGRAVIAEEHTPRPALPRPIQHTPRCVQRGVVRVLGEHDVSPAAGGVDAAECSRRADSLDTPCVHQLADASKRRCTAPGLEASASGTYTPKSSPERLSMTHTSPTRSCCVNGHHRSRLARAGAERSEDTRGGVRFHQTRQNGVEDGFAPVQPLEDLLAVTFVYDVVKHDGSGGMGGSTNTGVGRVVDEGGATASQ